MPKTITDKNKINEVLTRGVENIYPTSLALEKIMLSGKKLKLYNGIDPTGPTLHLGHLVQILKLKDFQDLGHQVVVLIGDFTAQIGDPTDKTATRKKLTHEQVMENCQGYKEQIGKVLDLDKTDFKYNSHWLEKLSFADTLELTSYFTAQQTLARDMFKKRIQAEKDLFLHEFLYPIMQAYDSVFMDVDLEIGGNDQMFNMLAGRTLMKKMKNKEKYVLTTRLLEDPTGKKMGKTESNMISLNLTAEDMYGKVMSWPDEFILPGFELVTRIPIKELAEIKKVLKSNKKNPKELKMRLALEITKLVHGEKAAERAQGHFISVIQKKEVPKDLEASVYADIKIEGRAEVEIEKPIVNILICNTKLASSKSEARRLVKQGGIKVEGEVVKDVNAKFKIPKKGLVIQRGKRMFVRIMP